MFFCLEDEVLDAIADAFRLRLLNHPSEDVDPAWDSHVVSLIKKTVGANQLKQFRGVAILPTLYKVYSRCLVLMATFSRFGGSTICLEERCPS